MDTSEQFIRMADCEEIQADYDWNIGDNYAYPDEGGALQTVIGSGMPTNRWSTAIWLPRQDQLQAMLDNEIAINLLYKFHHFYNTKSDYPTMEVSLSMEQLWLAFIMFELHSKKWDGDKWAIA